MTPRSNVELRDTDFLSESGHGDQEEMKSESSEAETGLIPAGNWLDIHIMGYYMALKYDQKALHILIKTSKVY